MPRRLVLNDRQRITLFDLLTDEATLLQHYILDDRRIPVLQKGDCLIVWKLDRLGRSLSSLIKMIDEFKEKGIGFKSITEQMDTTTPHGEFLFSIFGALAQYERALTKERIMAGLSAAKKRGKIGGRPRAISDEKMHAINEALKSGASKASICRTFNVKRTTLYDALAKNAILTQ